MVGCGREPAEKLESRFSSRWAPPNRFSSGNAKGAPGLAFETWDPLAKANRVRSKASTSRKKTLSSEGYGPLGRT
jgi:hypothetical protein